MSRLHGMMALAAAAAVGFAAPAGAADSDADFVAMAASDGILEVELGRHAAQKAADPTVRQFGTMMAADHTQAAEELKAAAARAGVPMPGQMSEVDRGKRTALVAKQGPAFDAAYMEAMVDAHEKAVDSFQEQADQNETEIDRWAAKTLPTLEKHLEHARSIHKQMQDPAAMEMPTEE